MINAGPTREYLDPVRFLSNPSSGKMGFALAAAAEQRGAEVTLVSGPVSLPTPAGVTRVDVTSAAEMLSACRAAFADANLFIATAAVGDYAPLSRSAHKVKKSARHLRLGLRPTDDILKMLARAKRKGQVVVGFAAETRDLLKNAAFKLRQKNLDLIVANQVSQPGIGFGSEENQVTLLFPKKSPRALPRMAKIQLAEQLWDEIEGLLRVM